MAAGGNPLAAVFLLAVDEEMVLRMTAARVRYPVIKNHKRM